MFRRTLLITVACVSFMALPNGAADETLEAAALQWASSADPAKVEFFEDRRQDNA